MLHIYDWGDGKTVSESNYPHLMKVIDLMIGLHEGAPGSPIVVHCSAGIGRTGCLIVLDQLCRVLKMIKTVFPVLKDDPKDLGFPSISIFAVVRRLRELRWNAVQTAEQYAFLYSFVGQYLKKLYPDTSVFGDTHESESPGLKSRVFSELYETDQIGNWEDQLDLLKTKSTEQKRDQKEIGDLSKNKSEIKKKESDSDSWGKFGADLGFDNDLASPLKCRRNRGAKFNLGSKLDTKNDSNREIESPLKKPRCKGRHKISAVTAMQWDEDPQQEISDDEGGSGVAGFNMIQLGRPRIESDVTMDFEFGMVAHQKDIPRREFGLSMTRCRGDSENFDEGNRLPDRLLTPTYAYLGVGDQDSDSPLKRPSKRSSKHASKRDSLQSFGGMPELESPLKMRKRQIS
jgi:hypothetical protein